MLAQTASLYKIEMVDATVLRVEASEFVLSRDWQCSIGVKVSDESIVADFKIGEHQFA